MFAGSFPHWEAGVGWGSVSVEDAGGGCDAQADPWCPAGRARQPRRRPGGGTRSPAPARLAPRPVAPAAGGPRADGGGGDAVRRPQPVCRGPMEPRAGRGWSRCPGSARPAPGTQPERGDAPPRLQGPRRGGLRAGPRRMAGGERRGRRRRPSPGRQDAARDPRRRRAGGPPGGGLPIAAGRSSTRSRARARGRNWQRWWQCWAGCRSPGDW